MATTESQTIPTNQLLSGRTLSIWNFALTTPPAEFQAYLKAFPDGNFTSLAAARLDDLKARQQAAGTAVAALSPARFDGKWEWESVELSGECGGARFSKFEVNGGSIKGSGRHPLVGPIRLSGKVDDQGAVSLVGSGRGVLLTFTGRLTESEGSGTVDVSGDGNCSGRWRVTRVDTN